MADRQGAMDKGVDMIEVRRPEDDELCGHVRAVARVEEGTTSWQALTVFGGLLGSHGTQEAAEAQVREDGLACLAEHWLYRASPSDEWQIVCIQEASPQSVRIALDFYSMPGVPTVVLARDVVLAGDVLQRNR